MKLLLFIFCCICIAETCLGAPTRNSAEDVIGLTNQDIERISNEFKALDGIDPKSVDELMNIFKKFRTSATEEESIDGLVELLTLAVNSTMSKEEFKTLLDSSVENDNSNENENTTKENDSSDGLSAGDLKKIETKLLRKFTPEQTKVALDILRGFRQEATSKETETALIDLFVAAIQTKLGGIANAEGIDEDNKV